MKTPNILLDAITRGVPVIAILSSGYLYLRELGMGGKSYRMRWNEGAQEWEAFDPDKVTHAERRVVSRLMIKDRLKTNEIALVFNVKPQTISSDVIGS